ncbi:alpha/beta fold hydrolase [Sphingomonas sp. R86520]|uniref:alpha/beta fold hydrolase n=1 Tax=Sphingomonas sp. R86520 TaxID=3093859 RepID=UPI0036D3A77D
MINRRDLATGTAIAAAATWIGTAAGAQTVAPAQVMPPKGPWTKFGDLQRSGGKLHYAMIGNDVSRPPIVLLHKLGGWLSDWRFVAPLLAQGRRVIAFDLPGHGGSRWLGTPPYIQSLGETAALLVGALDELGIDRIDLLGTSLGGCVAVPLAAFWPERINKLAIISSALGVRRSLAEIAINVDEKQKALFDAAGNPIPTEPALLEQIFGMVHAAAINVDGIASRKAAGHWIQPSERGVAITDIAGTLKRVAAPTLLVYGDRDKAYPKFRPAAEAALKHGRTAIVPNSGAFVMQDNPPATAAVLKTFLDEA